MYSIAKKGIIGILTIFALFAMFNANALAADEFGAANTIIGNADTAAKTATGTFMKWFFSFLPLVLMAVGAILGFSQQKKKSKKKSKQDQYVKKLYIFTAVARAVGLFLAILIEMLVSQGLYLEIVLMSFKQL